MIQTHHSSFPAREGPASEQNPWSNRRLFRSRVRNAPDIHEEAEASAVLQPDDELRRERLPGERIWVRTQRRRASWPRLRPDPSGVEQQVASRQLAHSKKGLSIGVVLVFLESCSDGHRPRRPAGDGRSAARLGERSHADQLVDELAGSGTFLDDLDTQRRNSDVAGALGTKNGGAVAVAVTNCPAETATGQCHIEGPGAERIGWQPASEPRKVRPSPYPDGSQASFAKKLCGKRLRLVALQGPLDSDRRNPS
jgi:hypothetical protein